MQSRLSRGSAKSSAPLLRETVATARIITSPAAYPVANGVMVAFGGVGARCPDHRSNNSLTVLKIGAGAQPTLTTAWCGALTGSGSPIVTTIDGRSDPIVWILGAQGDNLLHGFRGDTGAVLFAGGGRPGSCLGYMRSRPCSPPATGSMSVPTAAFTYSRSECLRLDG
jgi:hypothetical protein